MLLPAVAALDALFYLYHLPLCLAFRLAWRDGPRLGAGFAPADRRAAMARAERAAASVEKPRRAKPPRRLSIYLLRRAHLDEARITGSLCLGDAAATALACGALEALGCGLRASVPRLEVRLRPDFSGAHPSLDARGMIVARAGHIMTAIARYAFGAVIGRMKAWTSTPLRI